MNAPVSVVIPTYNGAAFLAEALESVFAQSLLPLEIIVVDDCSTDRSVEVVEALAVGAAVPLRVIRLKQNSGGPAVPINTGIAAASGELIAVLDQDDVYLPQTLERHAAALRAAAGCSFSFSLCGSMTSPESTILSEEHVERLRAAAIDEGGVLRLRGDEALRLLLVLGNFVRGFPGFVFRRSCWSAESLEPRRWRIVSDMALLRALAVRGDAAFAPHIGYLRREHEGNACRNRVGMISELLLFVSETLARTSPSLSDDAEIQGAQRRRLRWLAAESRVPGNRRTAIAWHARLLSKNGYDAELLHSFMGIVASLLPSPLLFPVRVARESVLSKRLAWGCKPAAISESSLTTKR